MGRAGEESYRHRFSELEEFGPIWGLDRIWGDARPGAAIFAKHGLEMG